jgi:hypothetical protein
MKAKKEMTAEPVNNIEKVICSYLEIETSYALLINGTRGIGKTFFIKNKIIPKIGNIKVYHDQRKSYKPVYISLYGLNSIDEVYTLFAFELLPFLKTQPAKVTLGIAKMLTRGLLNYQRAGNIDDLLKDIVQTTKGAIDTKDFVVIFDDLDRLSSKLPIDEFIGFVNSLVEHDNNKIIIIADQGLVKDQEIFKAVKEKTIGTTIEFISTFDKVFEEIIVEKYKKAGFGPFYKYLQQLKPLMVDLFAATGTVNLRTLIYFLQHFIKIFSVMYDHLDLSKDDPGELNLFKLKVIIRFALAICIEFKNGCITYTDPDGIDNVAEINAIIHNEWLKEAFADNMSRVNDTKLKSTDDEQKKSYKEQFIERYYGRETYHFYRAIFDFITGGNDFDVNMLLAELKVNIDDRRQQVFRQDELTNILSYPQVYDLSNDELKTLTAELYEFALNGQFSLDRYLSVFHFMERFPGILKNDPAVIADQLIAAVQKHADNFQYVPMLKEHFGIQSDQRNFEFFLKLFRELNKANEHVKDLQNHQTDLSLFETFKQDPQVFYKAVSEQYYDRGIFNSWDFDEFYKEVEAMKPNQLRALNAYLKNRYTLYEMPKWVETVFLKKLFDKVSIEINGEETLRHYVLEGTAEVLIPILETAQRPVNE